MNDPGSGWQRDYLRLIFFNQRGLRPGWRVLIWIALYYVVRDALALLLSPFAHRLPEGFVPSTLILGEGLMFLPVVLVTWIMSRIEHRQMGEYGLPLKNPAFLLQFLRGYVLWGFLTLSLLLLLLRALQAFYFGDQVLHDGQILYWGTTWALFFILVGLTEEYWLRGYLLYTLAEGVGFWPAAVILAAWFAQLHTSNAGETRIGILMTAFFAMFASVTLRYTGNLWLAVGAHAGWDWGESYFYGVSDSGTQLQGHLLNPHVAGPDWLNGGSTGPEGSILCLALMLVMSIVFAVMYGRKTRTIKNFEIG